MGRLALVSFSTIVALVLAEVSMRVFNLGPKIHASHYRTFRISENPALGYELLPRARDSSDWINDFGLRDKDYTLEKPEGVYRIAVVGDSIVYGWMLDRRRSFPHLMEKRLNQGRGPRYEVLNFGVVGYNVSQVAEVVASKVVRFDPDLVIYGYCLNDPQLYSNEMARLLSRLPGGGSSFWTEERLALLQRSRLGTLALYTYRRLIDRASMDPDEIEDPQFVALNAGAYAEYFQDLYIDEGGRSRLREAFDRLKKTLNVPVVVAIFPVFENLEDYELGDVHKLIGRELAAREIGVVDLLPIYRAANEEESDLFLDFLHPSARGNEIAAEALLEHLEREQLLPTLQERAAI